MAYDPLASSQINIDPTVGSRRTRSVDAPGARIAQLVAAGFTEEEALAIVQSEMGMHGAASVAGGVDFYDTPDANSARSGRVRDLRAREARQAAFEQQTMDQPAGADMSDIDAALGRQWDGTSYTQKRPMGPVNTPSAPAYGRRVPGARTLDGAPVDPGQSFQTEEEAAAYDDRVMGDGAFLPSQLDEDMAARGLTPVYNADGSVGYSVAAPASPHGSLEEATIGRGAPGRAGRRADLEAAGWVAAQVDSPLGPQAVYRPGQKAAARYDAQRDMRTMRGLAESAGISGADALAIYNSKEGGLDALRAAATARRIDDKNARVAAWRAQTMLAGANPRTNMANAFTMLDPVRQREALRYMLPGGQFAAAVDAQNMQNANDVVRRFMTSGAAGGFPAMNPALQAAQAAAANAQARQADPAAAGSGDIAARRFDTPLGQQELDRLARSVDTSWGGFSYENEQALSATLQNPPYSLSPAEADALAYRYAEKRRWISGGGPAGRRREAADDGGTTAAAAAPWGA